MRARASCLLSFDFRNSIRPFAATRSCEQPQVRPEQQDRGAAPPQPVTSRRASSLTATPPGLFRRVTGVPPGPLARFCKGWRARAHGLHAPLRKDVSARTRQRCGRRTFLRLPPRLPRVPGGTQRALTLRITSKRGRVPARRFPERAVQGAVSVCPPLATRGVDAQESAQVPQHTWCTMAEAHAADRGVSMEGEGAAGVHGFAFRERPVEEPGVPGPSPNTRAPMNPGDVEQVAREAAYAGAHPRWSGHRPEASGRAAPPPRFQHQPRALPLPHTSGGVDAARFWTGSASGGVEATPRILTPASRRA